MAKRPVHWYEGMFLKPHHFQAAERYARERIREAEDWHHPHDWGLRALRLDPGALANFQVVVLACQARLKDGTTLTIPEEAAVDPLDLRRALESNAEVVLNLALPVWQVGQGNIGPEGGEDGARFRVSSLELPDENTGGDEEPVEFRAPRARLLTSNLDVTGFELLPLARIRRGTRPEAPPEVDRWYIPPLLRLEAWPPLVEEVEKVFQQLVAVVRTESDYLVGRKIAFETQVVGDTERILKLGVLDGALAYLQGVFRSRGLHPFPLYGELCRLVGQLALFDEARRPVELPTYDHDNLGPCYDRVLGELRRQLGTGPRSPYEKRYFQLDERKRFQVGLKAEWTLEATRLYIGVETAELTDAECDELMRSTDWKLGSAEQVESIFKQAAPGLGMRPLNRIPPSLPRGVVYFEIERVAPFWADVLRTQGLGLRFKLGGGRFKALDTVTLNSPRTGRPIDLQFAVYAVKPS